MASLSRSQSRLRRSILPEGVPAGAPYRRASSSCTSGFPRASRPRLRDSRSIPARRNLPSTRPWQGPCKSYRFSASRAGREPPRTVHDSRRGIRPDEASGRRQCSQTTCSWWGKARSIRTPHRRESQRGAHGGLEPLPPRRRRLARLLCTNHAARHTRFGAPSRDGPAHIRSTPASRRLA